LQSKKGEPQEARKKCAEVFLDKQEGNMSEKEATEVFKLNLSGEKIWW